MLNYEHRFHGRASLNRVHKHGRVVRNQVMSLKYLANDRRKSYRCAVVVSRKVHGSAVVRNRIRRRVYETVRGLINENTAGDFIFVVFSDQLASLESRELQRVIRGLLKDTSAQANPLQHDMIKREEK